MKKLIFFLLFFAIIIGGGVYYFKVYDNHTGIRIYTTALDKGIEQVMADNELFTYKGLSIEERNVVCLLDVPEFSEDESFIDMGKANDVSEEMMRHQVKTMLYDKISDLVVPIHKLDYDFTIRLIGSTTRATFDIPFPHN